MSMYVRWANRVLALDALYDLVLRSYNEQLLETLLCCVFIHAYVVVAVALFLSVWL